MSIFALADLHLAHAIPEKSMEFFGEPWAHYTERIEDSWKSLVKAEDLVLIAGDISWAKHEKEALIDLNWIDQLPGKKILLKGNHDYWWASPAKLKKMLPGSMQAIQNNSIEWKGFSIGGSRLWDSHEYQFDAYVQMVDNPRARKLQEKADPEEQEAIFIRELHRLELSLQTMNPSLKKIAMTHYPPIGPEMKPTRASRILQKYQIDTCVFGHLHNVRRDLPTFGTAEGIRYILTAADHLRFTPYLLFDT